MSGTWWLPKCKFLWLLAPGKFIKDWTQFLTVVSVTHSRHSKMVTWTPQFLFQLALAERARKDDICWQWTKRDASQIPEMNCADEDVTKVMTSLYSGQHDRRRELGKHLDKPWSHPLSQRRHISSKEKLSKPGSNLEGPKGLGVDIFILGAHYADTHIFYCHFPIIFWLL